MSVIILVEPVLVIVDTSLNRTISGDITTNANEKTNAGMTLIILNCAVFDEPGDVCIELYTMNKNVP